MLFIPTFIPKERKRRYKQSADQKPFATRKGGMPLRKAIHGKAPRACRKQAPRAPRRNGGNFARRGLRHRRYKTKGFRTEPAGKMPPRRTSFGMRQRASAFCIRR